MKYRRIMLSLVVLSTLLLLIRISQSRAKGLPARIRLSSTAAREHAIRAYYRARQPDWRTHPPTGGHKDLSSLHNLSTVSEKWYGNPKEVGPSPYDFVPRPLRTGERKIRVLFLLGFKDYLERMNSHSYEM